jgi:hypothetical protein
MREDNFTPPIWLRETGTQMMIHSVSTLAEGRHYLVERFRGERNGVYQHTLWTIERAIAGTIDTATAREAFKSFAENAGILSERKAAWPLLFSTVGRPTVNLMGSFLGSNVRVWWQTPAAPKPLLKLVAARHGSAPMMKAPTKATALSVKRKATGTLIADLAGYRDLP